LIRLLPLSGQTTQDNDQRQFPNTSKQKGQELLPEFCAGYRNEALKPLCLKRSWSNFDPQAYYLYGEDQNCETSFKDKGLQAAVDSWCKIQVLKELLEKDGLTWKRFK